MVILDCFGFKFLIKVVLILEVDFLSFSSDCGSVLVLNFIKSITDLLYNNPLLIKLEEREKSLIKSGLEESIN